MSRKSLTFVTSFWFAIALVDCSLMKRFGNESAEESQIACTNRFEYRHKLQRYFTGCTKVIEMNPMCGRNYTVAFSTQPPYVYLTHGGLVEGILPDMIAFAMDSCCFGCNNVNYMGPYEHMERFFKDVSIVIPIQTSRTSKSYFGHSYVNMVGVKAVLFFGPPLKHDPTKMLHTVISSVTSTWPLFVVAFLMAATAGICVWLLDTKWNFTEFPSTFPRGPFEGFWWAFVSMTTVGYGDRSPKSVVARLFAVIWILVGITVFSMYTASLSSSLTSAVIQSHEVSLYQKKVAVLNTSSVASIAAISENIQCIGYESIEGIMKAYNDGTVEGIALDENVANFFAEEFASSMSNMTLYLRVKAEGSSYGMMVFNESVNTFFKSFFDNNDDQRDVMATASLVDHQHKISFKNIKPSNENPFFSPSSPLFGLALLGLLVISTTTTLGGLLGMWIYNKYKKVFSSPEDDQEELSLSLRKDEKLKEAVNLIEELRRMILKLSSNPHARTV